MLKNTILNSIQFSEIAFTLSNVVWVMRPNYLRQIVGMPIDATTVPQSMWFDEKNGPCR